MKVNLVTKSHKKMPPIGLELFAPILTNLVEEITKINEVLPKILDIKTEVCNTADTVRQMKVDVNDIKSKFSCAITGIEEAAKDICETECDVMEELHSFRQSIGANELFQHNQQSTTDGMNDQLHGCNYANAVATGGLLVRDDVTGMQQRSDPVCRSTLSAVHPASGAINKQRKSLSRRSSILLAASPLQLPPGNTKNDQPKESEIIEQMPSSDNEWVLVGRDKRKPRESIRKKNNFRQMSGVTGSRKGDNHMLKAAARTADVFVGRVDKVVDAEEIKSYVESNFGIQTVSLMKLNIRSEIFNAFKITVKSNDRDKLFNAELWPEDIVVNKFYNRFRTSNKESDSI